MTMPLRGEIYLVDFDPTRGHQIQKTRPALVVQNDIGNARSPITIVAAITSNLARHPVAVPILPKPGTGLSVPSAIHLGQIRSIDRERLVKRLGAVDEGTMRQVDRALMISLGLAGL